MCNIKSEFALSSDVDDLAAERQARFAAERRPGLRVSWAVRNHVFVCFYFIAASAVCALSPVTCVRIEPGRARAYLLMDHLAKLVPTQNAPGVAQ